MNTKIARKLNQCRHEVNPNKAATIYAKETTDAHNNAFAKGFIDLPALNFIEAMVEDNSISLRLAPKTGIITINDLYNLKTLWGADELNILTGDYSAVELVFKK